MPNQLPQDAGYRSADLSLDQIKRGYERLTKRITELEEFEPQSVSRLRDPRVEALEAGIDEALQLAFGHNTVERNRYRNAHRLDPGQNFAKLGRDINGERSPQQDVMEARKLVSEGKARSLTLLRQAASGLKEDIAVRELDNSPNSIVPTAIASRLDSSKIFIVHGHDGEPREAIARYLEKLGFEAVILHERPNKGRTIIAKFREEAAGVGFAVVLMTPDDLGKAEKYPTCAFARDRMSSSSLDFLSGRSDPRE